MQTQLSYGSQETKRLVVAKAQRRIVVCQRHELVHVFEDVRINPSSAPRFAHGFGRKLRKTLAPGKAVAEESQHCRLRVRS